MAGPEVPIQHQAAPVTLREKPGRGAPPPPTTRPDVIAPGGGGISRRKLLGLGVAGAVTVAGVGLGITRPWEESGTALASLDGPSGPATGSPPTTETHIPYEFGGFVEDMYILPRQPGDPDGLLSPEPPRDLRFVEGAEQVLENQLMTVIAYQKGISINELQQQIRERDGIISFYIPQRANDLQTTVAPPVFVRPVEIEVDLSEPVRITREGGTPSGTNSDRLDLFETANTVNIGEEENGGLELRYGIQRTWGNPWDQNAELILVFESIARIREVTNDDQARSFMTSITSGVQNLANGIEPGFTFVVDPNQFSTFPFPVDKTDVSTHKIFTFDS